MYEVNVNKGYLSIQGFYLSQFFLPHYSLRVLFFSTVKVFLFFSLIYIFCAVKFSYNHKRMMCFLKRTRAKINYFCSKEQYEWQSKPSYRDDQKGFWGFWEVHVLLKFGFDLSQNKTIHMMISLFPLISQKNRLKEIMLPLRKHPLGGTLPPGAWCLWEFQILKDFTKCTPCLLHKHLEASTTSRGFSDHGPPVWNPETLLIMCW